MQSYTGITHSQPRINANELSTMWAGMVRVWVAWQIKLSNPLVTYGPYLSTLELNGL